MRQSRIFPSALKKNRARWLSKVEAIFGSFIQLATKQIILKLNKQQKQKGRVIGLFAFSQTAFPV